MKTLIIHPQDKSTEFLNIVYKNIQNKTLVTTGLTKKEVNKLIESHDRIMMMGHGSPSGLFSVGQFKDTNGYIIDDSTVKLLNSKKDNVYIWCNADIYVRRHDLKGFYSGMFISEVGEAYCCGLSDITQDIVDESNYGFCDILSECILDDKKSLHKKVKESYGKIAKNNLVALYNFERLYVS